MVTPSFATGRVLLEVRAATLWNDTQNRFVTVGGDNGLRGFPINEFEGQRRFVTQLEYRSRALRILLARLGGVAFYDLGGAAESFSSMRLHHNVGVGVRALIPQMSPEPFRFDVSFALDGPDAGLPGRIIAGYRQAF
jgi:outer membrane translocation and assembly module TamA